MLFLAKQAEMKLLPFPFSLCAESTDIRRQFLLPRPPTPPQDLAFVPDSGEQWVSP